VPRQSQTCPARAGGAAAGTAIALAGLVALAVAMGVGRFAFTPILPMMQDDAGVSVARGGWLACANYAGYLAGALLATRRVRPRIAIRASLLAIALSTLGMGVAKDFAWWMALRAMAGIASAWALVHVSSWCLEQLAPLRKPVLSGAVFAGVGTGIVIAGGLCLALMSVRATAAHAWLGLGALSLAVTALVWPVLGVNGRTAEASAIEKHRWTPDALRLVFCYGAFGFGYIIPATFVPVMAKQIIADPLVFGWAWPIFGLTAAASTVLVALLPRIVGNRRLWMCSALAMSLGVASPLLLRGLPGIVVAAVLVGGTFMVITMAGMQEARRVVGGHASVLIAAMTAAFAAGQIAGPLIVSTIVDREGFSAALLFACALLVASAIALAMKEQP
jgi:MFS family permease